MPIRMVEDENPEQENNDNQPEQRQQEQNTTPGGGFDSKWLLAIPLLFRLFKGRMIWLVILAVGGYFVYTTFFSAAGDSTNSDLGRGCEMKEEIYDQAEVYEPLDVQKSGLPASASLQQYCPPPQNQGQQGSCVGWGSSYAARTILEASASGQDPRAVAFSPSYLYNQIGLGGCQGAYINKAMDVLTHQGVLPFKLFPYNQSSCDQLPSQQQVASAGQYKMKGYNRLTVSGDDYKSYINAIKQHIAAGAPVVIGMFVTRSFTEGMMGRKLWRPAREDYNGPNLGGHCMCLIGYDDNLEGGAFQIMNSWGPEWGENGKGWIKYADFLHFTQEAYGTFPMGAAKASDKKLSAVLGLVNVDAKQYIPLTSAGGNLFRTSGSIKKGQKFKMEIKNNTECYVYVFGQETDNSSYVLFPYDKKYSPYCGITGARLFPKSHSMQADNIGNKDYMAVVVSKTPLDYNKLNATVNGSAQTNYQAKFNEAFRNTALQNVRFGISNGNAAFECDVAEKKAVVAIVEINKQ